MSRPSYLDHKTSIDVDVMRRLREGPLGTWEHNSLKIAPGTLKGSILRLRAHGARINVEQATPPNSSQKRSLYTLVTD